MITDMNVWNSPVRKISARVEFNSSTSAEIYTSNDKLKSFSIERLGENSKFFGFGVCQKVNVHLLDPQRLLTFDTSHSCKCYLNHGTELDAFPSFKITEVHRDENTGELSITAYDALYPTAAHTVAELELAAPYTILDVANKCADFLGVSPISIIGVPEENNPFSVEFQEGANFDGAETLREVLNAIAEATQTVYYLNNNGKLVFKRLTKNEAAALTIGKADYITLDSKTNRRLSDICSATELGDNVITTSGIIGTVQYVRDNPFWELREDITTLLDNAIAEMGGLTINQFDCSWRGNPALEIGDKINLVTKDNDTVETFVLNDTIEYNGSLIQKTKWSYTDNTGETTDNPTNLGAALKKTFARVDKANKEVEIVAGETAAIKMTTDNITTSVKKIDNDVSELSAEVNTKMSAEDISIYIQSNLQGEVERVTTSTGFTFNEEGLHISKTNSEITTSITEDGMTVYKKNKEVLTADNEGVKAEDLHATTYLIIGKNSRLEDYDSRRTGCFWIGN